MSLSGRAIKIPIVWGKAKGTEEIKRDIHKVVSRALTLAVRDTVVFMEEVVPESAAAFFRYSTKQMDKSKELLETAVKILNDSKRALVHGGFKDKYTLDIDFPASYAEHIASKGGTWTAEKGYGWSKAGSKADYYCLTKAFLKASFCFQLSKLLKLKAVKDRNIGKYLGKVTS